MRVRLLLCGLLLALSSSPVEGQRPPALDTTAFSAHIASVARRAQIPHVSVVVVGPEGALYEAHIGSRTSGPGPSSRGLSEGNTRFYLGAVSETLTAFALMRLVDDGLVDLDAPVTRYLPDLDFGDPDRADRLTIRHLFTHHSGLPRSGFFNRRVQEEGRLDHIDFVREPGATLKASSLDYLVLGMVLEAVSGQRFSTLMSERVFEPIGMESAVADGETARSEGVATGHRYLFGWPVATEGHPYTDIMVPAAHMAASALDTGRFLSVLLNQGRRDDVRLLTASGAKALLPTPQDPTDGTAPGAANNGWGLMAWGGDADREDEEALMRAEAWFREGVSPGFHALMAVLPGEDLGVVVLANRTGGPGPSAARELLYGVVDRALGRPGRAYVPWERLTHLALLLFGVGWIGLAFRWHRRWVEMGRPPATAHTAPIIGRLALDLTVAAALPLVVVLGVEKTSIMALLRLHPDLGIAVILFPLAAIPMAVWRTLATSEDWRRSRGAGDAGPLTPYPEGQVVTVNLNREILRARISGRSDRHHDS